MIVAPTCRSPGKGLLSLPRLLGFFAIGTKLRRGALDGIARGVAAW
jgi:hypothetical protein